MEVKTETPRRGNESWRVRGGIGRMEMRIEGRDEDIGNGSKRIEMGTRGKKGGIETGKAMVAERMAMKRLTDDDEERG